MGRIQTSIGLISGIDIAGTVDQLVSLSARSRDLIVARNSLLEQQQIAVTELTALLIGVQLAAKNLAKPNIFTSMSASSADESLLLAKVTGQPVAGSYQYTPIRRAQSQQLLSAGVGDMDAPLGEGALSFRFGGFVDEGRALSELNEGQGAQRGKIRVTDRSGASAVIDLRFAETIDDVLSAITAEDAINVTAVADSDAIRLIDETGQSVANLKVQEVGYGSTAEDLGLAGIDVPADVATGQDIVRLHGSLALDELNDGNGVTLRHGLPDLEVTFRDGSSPLQIDFDLEKATLGDLIQALNEADPARLSARTSDGGDRIELVDLTANGGGVFSVSSPLGGTAAEDLGLTGASEGDVLISRRLQAGLKSSLLSSMDGGAGLGELGQLEVTDRSGATATIDLSSAETLEEVVSAINGAGPGVTARVNDARNGIRLADATGSTASHLIVRSGDATNSAEKLGIAVNAAVASVDGGSLHLQVFSEQLRLDVLNNGRGVDDGSFIITDSNGIKGAVSLSTSGGSTSAAETVGDVLDRINGLNIGVEARINDVGDGILLIDTGGGPETLRVEDSGSGEAAADLNLAGESVLADIGGVSTQVIDGATTFRIEVGAEDSLQDVIDTINAFGTDVSAVAFHDGSGATPHRISLVSQLTGKVGELLIDTTQFSLGFREIAPAQDALLLVGSINSAGAGVLASSSANVFDSVLDGVSLTVNGASPDPVAVTVETSDTSLVTNVNLLVQQYNKLRDKLDEVTFFNETDNITGILFGTTEALRIETGLSRLLSGRFVGVGMIESLGAVGVSLGDDGKLDFNEQKLRDRFAEDPDAVRTFFSGDDGKLDPNEQELRVRFAEDPEMLQRLFPGEELGVSAKIDALIETLAGVDNSLLMNSAYAIQSKIDINNERIASHDKRLDRERALLLSDFYGMEAAIAKMQTHISAIESIAPLKPIVVSRTNRN